MLVMCSKGCMSHQLLILYMVAINIYNITRSNRGTGDPLHRARVEAEEGSEEEDSSEGIESDEFDNE